MLDSESVIWRILEIVDLLVMEFSPPPCSFRFVGSKQSFQHPVPKNPQSKLRLQSAFHEKVPGGGGSGAVRGKRLLVGGLKGCYWWKIV
jgi:hypothetical protein